MKIEAPGSAGLVLAGNVVHLDPERAVFDAMLEVWARQQAARFLRVSTVEPRLRLVRRMAEFTGVYPWQWTPAEGEAFIAHLRGGPRGIKVCTGRGYEVEIGLFVEYLLDGRYGWRGFARTVLTRCRRSSSMRAIRWRTSLSMRAIRAEDR